MSDRPSDLKTQIADRIWATPEAVWMPVDFLDLGSCEAVDKTLQRLTLAGQIRRLDRGLYDQPRPNRLTGQMSVPRLSPRDSGRGAPRSDPDAGRWHDGRQRSRP